MSLYSSNSNHPDTLQDFIDLFTAAKAKYGNLKVRGTSEGVGNPDDYYKWDDIKVVTHNSLLANNGGDDVGYLIFEVY